MSVWGLAGSLLRIRPRTRAAAPRRPARKAGRRTMSLAFAILLYGVIGILIAAGVVWYVTAVKARFFGATPAPSLGEVQIVGLDEARTQALVGSLPQMVIAQLNHLKARTNAAIRALVEAEGALDTTGARPADPRFVDLPVPADFTRRIEIEFKVAEVELGWLVSLFVEQARDQNQVQISVSFTGDAQQASIFGFLPGDQGYSFVIETGGELRDIVPAIAAAILQYSVQRQDQSFEVLDAAAFGQMIDALADYSALERSRRLLGSVPDALRDNYRPILERIEPHARRFPGWRDLQWLASQLAERAQAWEAARLFYGNVVALTPPEDSRLQLLTAKLATIEERLRADQQVALAEAAGTDQADAPAEVAARTREAAARTPEDPRVARLRELIGLPAPVSAAGVRIGIVGGVPWPEAVAGLTIEEAAAGAGDDALRDYTTELLQAVRLVAPDATFVFAPIGGGKSYGGMNDLLTAMGAIFRADVDVVLLTWGADRVQPVIDEAIARHAEDAVIVLAAGNTPGTSPYVAVAEDALIACAADPAGGRAAFSASAPGSVWAPGEAVPIISPRTGGIELRAGTSFAAALVAGGAALLQAAAPEAAPAAIRQALVETAAPRVEGGPALLNIEAARTRLAGGS